MFTDKPDAPQPAYADVHPVPNEQFDPRAKRLFNGTAKLDRLYTGCRWAEGPAYFPAGRYLVWSDIPNNRMMRYDETDGSVSVFRSPANNTNGHTVDRQGRLVSCEHLTRRVTRTEFDGTITVRGVKTKRPGSLVGNRASGCQRLEGALKRLPLPVACNPRSYSVWAWMNSQRTAAEQLPMAVHHTEQHESRGRTQSRRATVRCVLVMRLSVS